MLNTLSRGNSKDSLLGDLRGVVGSALSDGAVKALISNLRQKTMKFSLLGGITTVILGVVIWRWFIVQLEHDNNQMVFLDVPAVAERHGYPLEVHHVVTADGYLLTLHRIPSKGRPVLIQHGYLQSSAAFLLSGPGHALGYLLADAGYDVWLGNSRGNYYSQDHVNSSITKHHYWDFSWHEMGAYDLPATIDAILNVTGRERLDYVGFSMGANIFFVMTSFLPEYNGKIANMIALAPAVYMNKMHVNFVYYYFVGVETFQWLLNAVGIYQILPRSPVTGSLAIVMCADGRITNSLCIVSAHHFLRARTQWLVQQGTFRQFDYGEEENILKYGQAEPPHYDVSKVTSPVTIFYGGKDIISRPEIRDA